MTDWSDPCAALSALRAAYYELIGGSSVARVELPDRTVEYAKTDLNALQTEISRLEGECHKVTTGRPRRFAITGGYRRT